MPRVKSTSNRQRKLQTKAAPKAVRTDAAQSKALASRMQVASGVVAQQEVRQGIEAQQALRTQVALDQDVAAGLVVGRLGPVNLKAKVEAEHGVGLMRDRTLPGVPFQAGGRDGIELLFKSKTLTANDVRTALAFRLAYHAASTGVGSCLGRAGEGGGGSRKMAGFARSAVELQRAYLLARLNQMERAVGEALLDGRELHALRMIAGEGHTVREVAGSSGAQRAYVTAALVRALEAIATALRITGQ